MAVAILEITYPCGYNYYLEYTGIGGTAKFSDEKLPTCPLHGKKCKKEN